MKRTLLWLFLILLLTPAFARVKFELTPFSALDFRNPQKLEELCAIPDAASFWCREEAELSLITTKGADYLFNGAGEVVALYAKQQNGQDFRGNYSLDAGQNLIPYTASVPGGAVLIDGTYTEPTDPDGSWQRLSDTEYRGEFSYTVGDYRVDRTAVVSHLEQTLELTLKVSRPVAGEETNVQVAFPGLARQADPVVKIGHGGSFTLDPGSQAIAGPGYVSLQSNNRNTGMALVVRPAGTLEGLAAVHPSAQVIALEKTLPAEAGAEVSFNMQVYGGPNELVRYYQEDFQELPGLFRPNLLGRLSLAVLAVLAAIHNVVGSWGLSIIVLTLLFRLLIWPLITTQTKSMVGMQQLQPKLQALQKKYKNDREKLTQETMKLYQEAGVNPAGGCLPILLQMPLFIILWRVFANFNFNEGFLWIPDLGLADPTYILPILYVGVMIAQSYFMSKGNPQSLRQQLLINVVFVFFIISFPAGVTLYWVVSMLVQVLQYYLINRTMPAPAKAA